MYFDTRKNKAFIRFKQYFWKKFLTMFCLEKNQKFKASEKKHLPVE